MLKILTLTTMLNANNVQSKFHSIMFARTNNRKNKELVMKTQQKMIGFGY